VLDQVNKVFPEIGFTKAPDPGIPHNGHENINVIGLARNDNLARFQEILLENAGAFGPGSRIDTRIGNGLFALHVEFVAYMPGANGTDIRFKSHIDRGNPNRDLAGLFEHLFVDVVVGALFHPHDSGLDPQ